VNALLVDSQAGLVYAGTDVGVFVSLTSVHGWTEVGPTPERGFGISAERSGDGATDFQSGGGAKTLAASTYGGHLEYALAPNYANEVSNSPQTVFPTQTAVFNGTLTALDGYSSAVNLSCAGAKPTTCTVNPAQATFSGNSTATYTLTAAERLATTVLTRRQRERTLTRLHTTRCHAVCGGFQSEGTESECAERGARGTSGASKFQVTASGSFAGRWR